MRQYRRKRPSHAHHPSIAAITAKSRAPVSVATWNVHHICHELNLWHFHPHDHRDVHNLFELHHGHWSLHTTGVSTTLSRARRLQCGSSAVFSTPALENWTGTTGTSITLSRDVDDLVQIIDELQLRNLHSFLHCHNPSTCCCTTTGVSTVSKNCKTRRCMITGTSATLMNCTKKSSTTLSRYCTAELPQFSARRTRHAQ